MQIFVSYVQNSKKMSAFFKDAFFILIGFKPALDAYRVSAGIEQDEHQYFPSLQEMAYCKCNEIICEAVPCSVIQIYVILHANERKLGAFVSILVLAATAGFTSAMLSYDADTSPSQRNKNPAFYGYVPDKALNRAICFMSMTALSFAQMLLLLFSCALLAAINLS